MDWRAGLMMAACVSAALVILGPTFAMSAARSVVRYAPYPYLSMVFTYGLWAMYGVDWGLTPLCSLSVFGALLGAVYVALYLWYSDPADPRLVYLRRYAVIGCPLFIFAITFDFFVPKTTFYSILCCLASSAASAAPLVNMPRALRDKSVESMPSVFIPTFALLNALLWVLKNTNQHGGWKDVDYYLVVASIVAAFCALPQLLMHIRFRQPPLPPTGLREPLTSSQNAAGQQKDDPESANADESAQPQPVQPPPVQPPQEITVPNDTTEVAP